MVTLSHSHHEVSHLIVGEILIDLNHIAQILKCEPEILLIDLCPAPVEMSFIGIRRMMELVVVDDDANSVGIFVHAIEFLFVEGFGRLEDLHLLVE